MKELGDAINKSLKGSKEISEVASRIKEGGYDHFLVLEANIGVSKRGVRASDKTSCVTTMLSNPELKISDQDDTLTESELNVAVHPASRTVEMIGEAQWIHNSSNS
jgi:hypothetical protein